MSEDFEQSSFKTLAATLAVIAFGWGSLWVGTQGVKIAMRSNSPEQANSSSLLADAGSGLSTTTDAAPKTLEPAVQKPSGITIMMGGDIMLDRDVRRTGNIFGYDSLFKNIGPLFATADIAVANLEGPITSDASKTLLPQGTTGPELTFTFATSTAPVLTRAHLTAVSLANNHTDNFGRAGLDETRTWLDAAGMKYFGDPDNFPSTETVIEKDGLHIAFVGYHAFQAGFDKILADVKRLSSEGDVVIVMPHWGVEYSTSSTPLMQKQAREFAQAGASAVIGSHPHVVGGHEWITGEHGQSVPVFYSLGNLVFDQYFSEGVMTGNIISLHINTSNQKPAIDSVHVYEVSTASERGPTLDGTEYDESSPKRAQ